MARVEYRSFEEFYPFYLSEHSRSGTRRLHFTGTLLVLLTLGYAVVTRRWGFLVLACMAFRRQGLRPSKSSSLAC